MEFTVPQFIEKEAKIVGPFTFKQFIFIGAAGGLCLFLYFILSFSVFIIVAVILLGGAFALAFLRIGRISLPVYIKNFFIFLFKPKVYLWKKKIVPPRVLRKEEARKEERARKEEAIKEEKVKKESPLTITKGSKLGELFTHLETKSK